MSNTETPPFVPILTVLPEYGCAPFLWLVNRPDQTGVGPNICDGFYWDETFPISEGLWQKFVDWCDEFNQVEVYLENFDVSSWDWAAYHTRGLQLARWLKEEVGDAFRVVYLKPGEDPDSDIDERREVLADGTLLPLPSFRKQP